MNLYTHMLLLNAAILLPVLLLLLVVRKLAPCEKLEDHKEVAGFIYSILGTIYAVILGFVIVVLWERFDATETVVNNEASDVADLHRLLTGFPASQRQPLLGSLIKYCELVINEEWPLLGQQQSSPAAMDQLREIWREAFLLNPQTDMQKLLVAQFMDKLGNLNDARRDRLLDSNDHLPRPFWYTLVFGGMLVIGFTFLFGVRNFYSHFCLMAVLTLSLGNCLVLVSDLDGPFSGYICVSPAAFKLVLANWDRVEIPSAGRQP